MSFDLTQFHQVFFDETREHLDTMERLLLALDIGDPDPEDLNAVFRAAHSIKGGSGTFGFNDMAEVTHVLESLLDLVRHGKLALSNDIIEASLQAGDVISNQLKGHRDGVDAPAGEAEPVVRTLTLLMSGDEPALIRVETAVLHEPAQAVLPNIRIHYQPDHKHQELDEALLAELGRLGSVNCRTDETGEVIFDLQTASPPSTIEDIFGFIARPDQYRIEHLAVHSSTPADPELESPPASDSQADFLMEGDGFGFFINLDKTKASEEDEQGYGFFVDLPVETATDSSAPASASVEAPAAARVPDATDTPRRRAADKEADTSIRVSVEKVDQLINLIGELVITNAMLAQTVAKFDPVQHENLFSGMGQLERNSRDLQEAVMSIRMLPINSVFSRFPRMVRDLAAKFGKQVELKMLGENTELDKGLIERLSDPLTHLVRNSLDHGIETTEQRIAAGKPGKGTLSLNAFHQGGNIIIEVVDDGAGLNRERILAKAIQQGIAVNPDAPDHEIWPLIFAPGFSTAEVITDVSGRGVGMDVVKRNIEGMGGRVEIYSTLDKGTRISIRLPLTLAILDGMSVGVGLQAFIVPLNAIVESLQPKREALSSVSGQGRVVQVRGEYLPIIALHKVFNIPPCTDDPCEGILVILEVEGGKVALFVDELLGQHQVVIKSLETNYRRVRGVSGATIMGDGHVALILDVGALVQLSRE